MQDYLNTKSGNEHGLRELIFTLWAYKVLVICICILTIFCSGYYALTTTKEYTSTAIFSFNKKKSDSLSLFEDLETLGGLAGIGGGSSKEKIPENLINGQIFIEKIDTKLDLQSDSFFNSYNPEAVDPLWKTIIKRAIGWKKPPRNDQEIIWHVIKKAYLQNIKLETTDDGTYIVSFTHVKPERAALIANAIMEEVILFKKQRVDSEQDAQLIYLSTTLAKALNDLEISQSKLKAFALENSALPLENFAVGSLQLDVLRDQLNRTTELHGAVAELLIMLKNNTTTQADYLSLRQAYPIVDQVEFRRVLGQNEIISSWSWPEISTVMAVYDTLSERKNRLESEIGVSQIDAERSAKALETYARLEREANIAEATYTVLIEQVKAQSMMAGYRPSNSEIYEYASTSINPSAPKRKLILALGAVLGLLLGSAFALLMARFKDVFYSRKTLIASTQARLNANIRSLRSLQKKNLKETDLQLQKKPRPILYNFMVEIHKSGCSKVVVSSSRTKMMSNKVAQALALQMQSDEISIAIIDFSKKAQKQSPNARQKPVGPFKVIENEGNVSVLMSEHDLSGIELIKQKNFLENIQSLNSEFNLVFLCADNDDAISLLRALEGQDIFHLTNAKVKSTKVKTLHIMQTLLPIQGLLHD